MPIDVRIWMARQVLWLLIFWSLSLGGVAQAGVVLLGSGESPGASRVTLNGIVDVFEDPDGQLTLSDIRSNKIASQFRHSAQGFTSFGFTHSAYWFRFDVRNPSSESRHMLLVLRSAWLDSIRFYQPDAAGEFVEQTLGDTQPFAQRAHVHPEFLIDLHAAPGMNTYYLRLATQEAFMTPIELWQPAAFYQSDRQWAGYFGMLYGVLFVMVLYNGFIWLSTRERSYLFYCLYLLAFFIMNFSYSGFSFEYLWPNSPRWANWSYSSWIFLYLVAAVFFALVFLEARFRLSRIRRLLQVFLIVMVATWLLTMVTGHWLAYNAAAVVFAVLLTPLIAFAGIAAWRSGYKPARFFVLASMATLIGSLITALTVSGYLHYSFATFHAAEFGIMADVVLLALALADRINILREEKEAAERDIMAQKLQANAVLERTVRARTAELALARDEAERLARTDGLTGVSNRRNFEEVAGRAFLRARRYGHALSLITFDIDLFKQINDTHGHAGGDAVLKVVANEVAEGLRAVDLVARIGGEEFAVLLPDITGAQAAVTAERLRERIAEQELVLKGSTVRFTASFGVAQLEDGDSDFEALLQRSDQMMYRSKRAGRNRVSTCAHPDEPTGIPEASD